MMKLTIPMLLLLPLTMNPKSWALITLMFIILTMVSLPFNLTPLSQEMAGALTLMDFMSSPLITLTLWITALMLLASTLTKIKMNNPSLFLITTISLTLILVLSFSVNNLMLFYVMFEASLIPTLFLILNWGYQPERSQAGNYLMMYTVTASLPLLAAIMSLYQSQNHISLTPMPTDILINPINTLMASTLILAFLVKMPVYISHLWLPKAHVEAPVAGSMILAGILLKLGSYGILRMAMKIPATTQIMQMPLVSLSLWGAVATSMTCIRQQDMKSLIAYSSVGHMALMTTGIFSSSKWGWEGALLMMIAHGLSSSALFALANSSYESTKTRSMFLTKGLMNMFPTASLWWFLAAAANMAAPPTLNLMSEIMLLTAALYISPITAASLASMSFLAAAYSLILFTSPNHGNIMSYSSNLHLYSPRNSITAMLHSWPLYSLILGSIIISSWI